MAYATSQLTPPIAKEPDMPKDTSISLPDLDDRIAIIRDNLRQLTEQAAGSSGAADEERNADRIADQQAELDRLVKQREALVKKQ